MSKTRIQQNYNPTIVGEKALDLFKDFHLNFTFKIWKKGKNNGKIDGGLSI
jgi:hypothetical protein